MPPEMPDATRLTRTAAAASLLAAAGLSAAARANPPPAAQSAGPTESSAPEWSRTDTLAGDTVRSRRGPAAPPDEAVRLDSLRRRAAELRAELIRLQTATGARIERRKDVLRIEVPVSVRGGESATIGRGRSALLRLATLVRRYYPEARVLVVGTAWRHRNVSGSPRARRRAEAAVRSLTTAGGLGSTRVRRVACGRAPAPHSGSASSDGTPAAETAVTLVLTFGRN